MSTISTLAYKIVMDQSGFTKGASLASKEVSELKRLFMDTREPIEKYRAAVERLNDYHKRGVIDADLFARAQRKLHDEFRASIPYAELATQKTGSLSDALKQTSIGSRLAAVAANPFVLAVAAITATAGAAVLAVKKLATETLSAARSGMEFVDAQDEAASKIGVSVQMLMALRQQAQLSGVAEDSLATSIQKMGINIATGNDKASAAIKGLGLTVTDLQKMDAGSAYRVIADQISRLPSAAQQGAAAMAIFGKSGKDIVGVLQQGADALKQFQDSAARMGFGLTDAEVARIAEANDHFGMIGKAVAGIGVRAANQMGPAIAEFADRLVQIATSPAVVPYLEQFFAGAGGLIHAAAKGMRRLHGETIGWSLQIAKVQYLWNQLTGDKAGMKMAFVQMQELVKEFQELQQPLKPLGNNAPRGPQQIGTDGSATDEGHKNQLTDSAKRLNSVLAEAKGIYEQSRTPQQQYADTMRKLNAHLAAGTISWKTWGQAVSEAKSKLHKGDIDVEAKRLDAVRKEGKRIRDSLVTDTQKASNELAKAVTLHGLGGLDSMSVESLARKQAIAQAGAAPTTTGFTIAQRGSLEDYQATMRGTLAESHQKRIETLTQELITKANEQVIKLGNLVEAFAKLSGTEEG